MKQLAVSGTTNGHCCWYAKCQHPHSETAIGQHNLWNFSVGQTYKVEAKYQEYVYFVIQRRKRICNFMNKFYHPKK